MHPKKRTQSPPQKTDGSYKRLWKIVDGAVADAFTQHPEYLATNMPMNTIRASINKRVVGAVLASVKSEGLDGDNAS